MNEPRTTASFHFIDLASLEGVGCPCGTSRRGFTGEGKGAFSLHLVEISRDARVHYHRKLTEVYYFLSGKGELELDGERHPVRPGLAVLIPPGVRHRAIPGPGA